MTCSGCSWGVYTYSCYCEHVKDFGAVPPRVSIAVFGLALIC